MSHIKTKTNKNRIKINNCFMHAPLKTDKDPLYNISVDHMFHCNRPIARKQNS